MAASAVMFTTSGASAWFTSPDGNAHMREEARQAAYRSWAEDDKRRIADESGYDPSSPERVRDGLPPREDTGDMERRSVPFSGDQTDDAFAGDQ